MLYVLGRRRVCLRVRVLLFRAVLPEKPVLILTKKKHDAPRQLYTALGTTGPTFLVYFHCQNQLPWAATDAEQISKEITTHTKKWAPLPLCQRRLSPTVSRRTASERGMIF